MRHIEFHDVAQDLDLADPSTLWGLPRLLLHWLQRCHRTAALGHGNRIAPIIDFVEEGEALGL